MEIIAFLSGRLGIEIDIARELERVASEQTARQAEDGFVLDETDFDA